MKALILALILLVAPMVASAKQSGEQCLLVAQAVFWAAQGRDLGSSPQDIYQGQVAAGVPSEVAEAIVNLVFLNPDISPEDMATETLNRCTSEAV